MPIEIRELIIKVAIEEHPQNRNKTVLDTLELKKAIVKDCVELVLSKLESQMER